ncbi:hypothetical protein [Campylobacter hyointestinalis]|nr:hypothetical protein [Campylobacter hyointestinalis]MDY2999485.1 hypothetical protein [Campylobacter hyointestinalis]
MALKFKVVKAKKNLAVCLKYGYVLKARYIKKFNVEREIRDGKLR